MPASPLLARLMALERTVAQLAGAVGAGSEAAVPNAYTIDANGNIVVTGVNLPAGTSNTPPNADRIRWIRTTDGAVVADLYADSFAGGEELLIRSIATAATDSSRVTVKAIDDLQHNQVVLDMVQTARGTGAQMTWQVGANSGFLMNDLRQSNFVQLPGAAQRMDVAAGYIDGRAASFGLLLGYGCSATRSAVGKYTITLNPALTNAAGQAIVTAWSYGLAGASVINSGAVINSGRLDFSINNLAGAAVDDLFAFIAVG